MQTSLMIYGNDAILLDITGENNAERALLVHLQDGHKALLCAGDLGINGVRVFIRNKQAFDFAEDLEGRLRRKGQLDTRRRKAKKR